MIKQKLAGNQLIVAYLRKVKAMKSFELKPQITSKSYQKIFKPIARVDFTYNNNSISLYNSISKEARDKEMKDGKKL